jgi:hypothetical protein
MKEATFESKCRRCNNVVLGANTSDTNAEELTQILIFNKPRLLLFCHTCGKPWASNVPFCQECLPATRMTPREILITLGERGDFDKLDREIARRAEAQR